MNLSALKVLFLGPVKGGKSTLANCVADAKENPVGDYRPTVGCRILEFQLDTPVVINKGNSTREIRIWDCSGDAKYQNCWNTMAHQAQAVLLVYNAAKEEQIAELEGMYSSWNQFVDLSPSRYLVVARKWGEGQVGRNRALKTGSLARLSRVEWDIDLEAPKVRSEFTAFIDSVMIDVHRRREEDEITILRA